MIMQTQYYEISLDMDCNSNTPLVKMKTLSELNIKVGDKIKSGCSKMEYTVKEIIYKTISRNASKIEKTLKIPETYILIGEYENEINYKNINQKIWIKVI